MGNKLTGLAIFIFSSYNCMSIEYEFVVNSRNISGIELIFASKYQSSIILALYSTKADIRVNRDHD